MYGRKHTFSVKNNFQDKKQQCHLELIFVSVQKYTSFGHTPGETNLFVLQTDYSAPDSWTALRTLKVASAEVLKRLFALKSFPQHISFAQCTITISGTKQLSYRKSGVSVLYLVNALNKFTFVCNVASVLAEMAQFALIKVDIFCKCPIITL